MNKQGRPGRPAGSGAQLPPGQRARQSRDRLKAAGGRRLDFTLDAHSAEQLAALLEHWQCGTRKEAVERAIAIVYQTIAK